MAAAHLHAKVEGVAIGDLEKYHLDQNLGLGLIEVSDDLGNVLAGLFISNDDEPARLRVRRHDGFAHGPRRIVLPGAGGSRSAKRSAGPASGGATGHALG